MGITIGVGADALDGGGVVGWDIPVGTDASVTISVRGGALVHIDSTNHGVGSRGAIAYAVTTGVGNL